MFPSPFPSKKEFYTLSLQLPRPPLQRAYSSSVNSGLRINGNFGFEEDGAASTEAGATILGISADQLNRAPSGRGLANSSRSIGKSTLRLLIFAFMISPNYYNILI